MAKDKKTAGKGPEAKTQGKEQAKAKQPPKESVSIGEKVGQLKEFFEESQAEIKKVTWPSRRETMVTSIAVLILVVIMSLFLGIVDLGLSKAIEVILS